MKQTLLLLMLLMAVSAAYSQDYIIKKNGEEVKSKIVEILNDRVVYKEYDHQDGPIRSIDISDIDIILYENGKRERLPINNSLKVGNKDDSPDYYISGGIGHSYGLIGLRFLLRTFDPKKYGFQFGFGYSGGNSMGISLGLKRYIYKDMYLSIQYCRVVYRNDQYDQRFNFSFPAVMLGGDWTWGTNTEYGFSAGLGVGNKISKVERNFLATIDLGFLIKFK